MTSLISFTMRCRIRSNFAKKRVLFYLRFLSSNIWKRSLKKHKKTHHLYSSDALPSSAAVLKQASPANNKYSNLSCGKFICKPGTGTVSRMTVRLVTITFPDYPRFRVTPYCSMDAECRMNSKQVFVVRVPKGQKDEFEKSFLAQLTRVTFTIFYRKKDVSESYIGWGAQDIQNTSSYKSVISGGSNFVSANQVQTVLNEAINSKSVVIFRKFLDVDGSNSVFVKSRDQAAATDAQLMTGTGLTAQQFAPITVMWDVTEQISNSTSFSDANDHIRAYFNKVN